MDKVIDCFKGKYEFLSNFYYENQTDRLGRVWASNEHFFQACKTNDPKWQEYIWLSSYASLAKKRGREAPCRKDWNEIKDNVMLSGLRMKFGQNFMIRVQLMETNGITLIEGNNWGDTYWGVCRGVGQNKLGILLMQVRSELIELTKTLTPPSKEYYDRPVLGFGAY